MSFDKFAQLINNIDQYFILSLAKVYGPYEKSDGRKIVIIKDENGTRTVSFPKYLMEQHLNRTLDKDMETIDHIDFNKDNNNLDNLRIVPRDIHSGDDTRRVKLIELSCVQCGNKFERSPRLLRDKSSKGNAGPFCSRSCSGKYSRRLQLKQTDKLPIQPHIESEYYRRKNVAAMIDYLGIKYS